MKNLVFPTINDTPFKPFCPILVDVALNAGQEQQTIDLSCFIKEFVEQLTEFSKVASHATVDFQALLERSDILVGWVLAIEEQYVKCKSLLKQKDKKALKQGLLQMKTIYANPLLSSIWLGLENVQKENNKKEEIEFLQAISVATHYKSEMTKQFCQFLNLVSQHFDIASQYELALAIENNSVIVTRSMQEKFIVEAGALVYELAVNGHLSLLRGGTYVYNHYLNFVNNKRLTQDYLDSVRKIKEGGPRRYTEKESIYATSEPIFDAHIFQGTKRIDMSDVVSSRCDIRRADMPMPEALKVAFDKFSTNLDFIVSFRGRKTQFKTKNYSQSIKSIILGHETVENKARNIQITTASWRAWILRCYPNQSILIEETASIAAAISVKLKNLAGVNDHV